MSTVAAASVVALDGPIGVGKTTLGRSVAAELQLGFVDGDDHSGPGPWFRTGLQTSRRIVAACHAELAQRPAVILAYPLRCINWVFYRETFQRDGVRFHCIGLIANYESLVSRTRVLSPREMRRAAEMIAQGYGQRPFSALQVRTDQGDFQSVARRLAERVRALTGH
ncbi:MAG: hypothetical protein AAFR17_02610 [Pseudomonadota bacterium]